MKHEPLSALAILFLLLAQRVPAAELFYLGQKIPDIQRLWDSADYRQLIAALQEIDETQVNALLRRSGEFTGSIYQRMVSEENFRSLLNIYAPLELRQDEPREVLFELKELMRLDFDFKPPSPHGAEALGLMTYSLSQQAILFTLTIELWMTLSEKKPGNAVRQQDLQETKAASAMLTSSALDYLGLTRQFNREDLVLYSAEPARRMPKLLVHLGSGVRGHLLARVADVAEQPPTPSCAPAWANCSRCWPASSRMWKANWPSLPRRGMPAQSLTSAHHPQLQRNKPKALARATAWVRRSTPSLPLI